MATEDPPKHPLWDQRSKPMGRPKGVPNRVTTETREAFKKLVEGHTEEMWDWLQQTANGVWEEIEDPETGETRRRYILHPNPGKAIDSIISLAEFTVPKLARTELVGDPDAPIKVEAQVSMFGELIKGIRLQRQSESD